MWNYRGSRTVQTCSLGMDALCNQDYSKLFGRGNSKKILWKINILKYYHLRHCKFGGDHKKTCYVFGQQQKKKFVGGIFDKSGIGFKS